MWCYGTEQSRIFHLQKTAAPSQGGHFTCSGFCSHSLPSLETPPANWWTDQPSRDGNCLMDFLPCQNLAQPEPAVLADLVLLGGHVRTTFLARHPEGSWWGQYCWSNSMLSFQEVLVVYHWSKDFLGIFQILTLLLQWERGAIEDHQVLCTAILFVKLIPKFSFSSLFLQRCFL